jgi:hypothetical protein
MSRKVSNRVDHLDGMVVQVADERLRFLSGQSGFAMRRPVQSMAPVSWCLVPPNAWSHLKDMENSRLNCRIGSIL